MTTTSSELRVLQGRFRLLQNLARGGMGTVWLADDMQLERAVALKELVKDDADADTLRVRRERAMREAKALAKVRHPAIVAIHDVIVDGDDPWIVMEYISGRSLDKILQDGPLDERAIARYALQVLNGLSAAHRAGVVHRDVKPANILVAEDGSVSLVDFGIAAIDGATPITTGHMIVGTLDYVAPERFQTRYAGPASDLWSLGVTLFYAWEGYLPFRRTGDRWDIATMNAILNDDPPPFSQAGELGKLIVQLLSKDPARRPGAPEVARFLSVMLNGQVSPDRRPAGGRSAQVPADRTSRTGSRPVREHADGERINRRRQTALDHDHEGIAGAGADAAAAMMLAMPPERAAEIMVGYRAQKCGELLQGIAAARPRAAGAILQIMPGPAGGRVMRYLKPETAASVLDAEPTDEAVRNLINLIRADTKDRPVAAAAVITYLPATTAVRLLKQVPDDLRSAVLHHTWPAILDAMADVDPDFVRHLRQKRSSRSRHN